MLTVLNKKKKGTSGGGGFSYCEYHFKMTLVSLQVADGELPLVASHGWADLHSWILLNQMFLDSDLCFHLNVGWRLKCIKHLILVSVWWYWKHYVTFVLRYCHWQQKFCWILGHFTTAWFLILLFKLAIHVNCSIKFMLRFVWLDGEQSMIPWWPFCWDR